MSTRIDRFFLAVLLMASASARAQTAPNVSQVLLYSTTMPSGAVPNIYSETQQMVVFKATGFSTTIGNANYYTSTQDFVQMSETLNSSIATALSIIPLSSPASGVIERKDPATGADLAESSTLGPIFTERAETIGKGRFYIGFSNQDFHFTQYNGTSLNALTILDKGGAPSNIFAAPSATTPLTTRPATFGLGMDVRLSQNIAFLTYGVSDRFDVSVGLPVVHSAVAARTYDGTIWSGAGNAPDNVNTCWCVNTFTPGKPNLFLGQIGTASYGKTGFGDLLVRAKGTVYRKPNAVVAIGADVRFPTGDASNYLGVGTTSVKPFVAVSFYTKRLQNGIVLSPHFDAGWQFSGKSILGGALSLNPAPANTESLFTASKGYVPDVFSWAGGVEVALGKRNTLIADILGNQIGWIHGMPDARVENAGTAMAPAGAPPGASDAGLVSVGNVSFGQYNGSFGYKLKIAGSLVANFNVLVRLDNNGLTARVVPLFGLGYSF